MSYGIVYPHDEVVLDKTIAFLCEFIPEPLPITLLEVGVAHGDTARGVVSELSRRNREFSYSFVDIAFQPRAKEFIEELGVRGHAYEGDSFDVARHLQDGFFDWVFIDGCHDFPHVVADFLAYKSKVRNGGLLLFHDVTPHVNPPVPDYWQGHGEKGYFLRHVAVRPALEALGLLGPVRRWTDQFRLVLEDPGHETSGGVAVFQRIHNE